MFCWSADGKFPQTLPQCLHASADLLLQCLCLHSKHVFVVRLKIAAQACSSKSGSKRERRGVVAKSATEGATETNFLAERNSNGFCDVDSISKWVTFSTGTPESNQREIIERKNSWRACRNNLAYCERRQHRALKLSDDKSFFLFLSEEKRTGLGRCGAVDLNSPPQTATITRSQRRLAAWLRRPTITRYLPAY